MYHGGSSEPMSRQLQQAIRVFRAVQRATGGKLGLPATLAIAAVVAVAMWLAPTGMLPPPGQGPAPTRQQAFEPDSGSLTEVLTEVGRDAYRSPAGLRYTRGSRHGHRVAHLLSHCEDDPSRDGQHGVFDVDDAGDAVLLVDEAYEQAERGQKTRKKRDGDRTVYTVDLGRRVGYVGGQSGRRRGKPAASHVRLVVEGDRLITAYPVIP